MEEMEQSAMVIVDFDSLAAGSFVAYAIQITVVVN